MKIKQVHIEIFIFDLSKMFKIMNIYFKTILQNLSLAVLIGTLRVNC